MGRLTRIVDRELALNNALSVALWVGLNIADSILTFIIIGLGGEEFWLVYQLSHSMTVVTVAKYAGVAFTVLVLAKIHRLRWLLWFNLGISLIVAWNLANLMAYFIL